MASHLSSGRVNLLQLREKARKGLFELLDKYVGEKAIVWDVHLEEPFGLISEYMLLQEHNVRKMFHLLPNCSIKTDAQHIIFMVRPKLELMDVIAEHVLVEEKSRNPKKEFYIFFVPRKSHICMRKLQERGVYGAIHFEEYALELFPVDSDVLSMEMDFAYRECHIENDTTALYHVAKALMTLQSLYGVIPNVHGKGKYAKMVFDMMLRMRKELSGSEPQIVPQIDTLLLIDRSIDLLTPFATQLTYEGLLDEIFGIHNNIIKLPPHKFQDQSEGEAREIQPERKQFCLNSSESLFAELRDKNFNAVGPMLSWEARNLSSQFEVRHEAKTIGEIKQFVDRLPTMQQKRRWLANHTSMAELIKEVTDKESFFDLLAVEQEFMNGIDTDKINPHIEECIAREESIYKVLRLICMQCFANNGLKQKVLEYYKKEILQTYGFQYILCLKDLERAGLLYLQGTKTYSVTRKTLKLTVEDVNEQAPNDISYVHSGYAPLSVRLAQFLAQPGWRAINDVLKLLPGPTFTEVQQKPMGMRRRRGSISSLQSSTDEQKVTLVFFLGGCTFAEISALRFLSQQDDAPVEYIVATTKLINGTTFLKSIIEPVKLSQ
ncbi:vacuolar protein sorting-associated protein 33A-like [Ornithodoros turicata]|uniref:vacuolar protein sorting-associated protein 33A-like n=1 Tax=Ornithodoros turicata TaxID=34597 RepID=UPI00313A2A90